MILVSKELLALHLLWVIWTQCKKNIKTPCSPLENTWNHDPKKHFDQRFSHINVICKSLRLQKVHRVHSGPKTKKWPQSGGGPVGFSFNARPNQTWLQSVHFGFSFSRAITAFTPLHIGYSAKQTKHGCFQEESRPNLASVFTRKQTKNGFNTNLMTKK